MLPKKAYSLVTQGLKHIKAQWDEDRAENPTRVPYDIDSQLKGLIERSAREGGANVYNRRDMEILVQETINYLVDKSILVGSPYGGVFFPLPKDHAPLPTKEELEHQVLKELGNNEFFGKKAN